MSRRRLGDRAADERARRLGCRSAIADPTANMTDADLHATLGRYFSALHECDADAFHRMWHPRGILLGLGPAGEVVQRDAATFCEGVVKRGQSTEYAVHDQILLVERIDSTCASAKVRIALPPAPDSPTPTLAATLYTDWLTLLKDPEVGWRVISKIYSSKPLVDSPALEGVGAIDPADFAAVSAACWDGYVAAGRACDGAAMARVFHSACNLTFVLPSGVVVVPSKEFCERVATRWSMEAHAPYAHLKDDPRATSCDSLVSIDFAGPNVCRCILRIGYPPFLYTDVLLLLKQSQQQGDERADCAPGWWIVAKSSGNVPFLADERQL